MARRHAGEREDGARLADAVERIRWRLWHGRVQRALDLVGETLAWLEGMAGAAATGAAKVAALLRGLETYVSGQAGLIIDYAKARRSGRSIATPPAPRRPAGHIRLGRPGRGEPSRVLALRAACPARRGFTPA